MTSIVIDFLKYLHVSIKAERTNIHQVLRSAFYILLDGNNGNEEFDCDTFLQGRITLLNCSLSHTRACICVKKKKEARKKHCREFGV